MYIYQYVCVCVASIPAQDTQAHSAQALMKL